MNKYTNKNIHKYMKQTKCKEVYSKQCVTGKLAPLSVFFDFSGT